MFIYLLSYLFIFKVFAAIIVKDRGVIPLEKDSVGMQFYINIENTNRLDTCRISSRPKRCCLDVSGVQDCETMTVSADFKEDVKPRNMEMLVQVYPTIYQHDQVGYCDFILSYRCGLKCQRTSRQMVNITFDTRLSENRYNHKTLGNYFIDTEVSKCDSLDEDSLNQCNPVDCYLKYGGGRPVFDDSRRKCLPAVTCNGDPSKQLPDIVYIAESNSCRDLDSPLSVRDIYDIDSGLHTTNLPARENVLPKIVLNSNCSTISENLQLLRDLVLGKLCININNDTSGYRKCMKVALMKILMCILGICAALIIFVFCLYMAIFFHEKQWKGDGTNENQHWRRGDTNTYISNEKSVVDVNVRNNLIRDVIVRDIPLELRNSGVDVCDRIGNEIRWKTRYRSGDMAGQVNFSVGNQISRTSSSYSEEDEDEQQQSHR